MTGETAFHKAYGTDIWEYRRRHAELDEYFNAGLKDGAGRMAREILKKIDFSRFRTVADIGGGYGNLLAVLLKACPWPMEFCWINRMLPRKPAVTWRPPASQTAAG